MLGPSTDGVEVRNMQNDATVCNAPRVDKETTPLGKLVARGGLDLGKLADEAKKQADELLKAEQPAPKTEAAAPAAPQQQAANAKNPTISSDGTVFQPARTFTGDTTGKAYEIAFGKVSVKDGALTLYTYKGGKREQMMVVK